MRVMLARSLPGNLIPPSGPTTLSSVDRDSLTAAGGERLTVVGTGFYSGMGFQIAGLSATGVNVLSPTLANFLSPSGAVTGSAVAITADGGGSLAAAVTYYPALATTYANGNFDDSTAGSWSLSDNWVNGSSGSHSFSTDHLLPWSTKCLKCTIAGPTSGDVILHKQILNNPMLNNPNGVFIRFYVYAPDATVTALQPGSPSHQQKWHLFRGPNQSNPPSWGMVGCGSAFHAKRLTLVQDYGTNTKDWSTFDMGDAQGYVEVQLQMNRKSNTGTLTWWHNGVWRFSETSTAYGSDVSSDDFTAEVGAVYSIVDSSIDTYFEDVTVSDGYIPSSAP